MALQNTQQTYGNIAKTLHWVSAGLVIFMIAVGFMMTSLKEPYLTSLAYKYHKATGVLVFGIVLLRLFWKFTQLAPRLPSHVSLLEKNLSKLSHFFLYILMVGMPLSGLLMSLSAGHAVNFFDLFTIPPFSQKSPVLGKIAHTLHEIGGPAFLGLILLHIAAAFYHHFFRKDDIMKRMFGH